MGLTFTWDAEDRVKIMSYNGTQKRIEYDYDGQGRRVRIRSMEGGVKTAEYLYIWDGLQLCEKRDSAVETFPVAIYYPQGERKFLSGTYINYFYLRDRLGSVRGATSDTGSIIQSSDHLPYGPPTPQQPATPDPDFGFTGHLKCPFTGLTLAPYRVLGYASWLSRDPIGEAGGINLYNYVANNPVNLWDTTGEFPSLPIKLLNIANAYERAREIRTEGHQRFPGPENSSQRHQVASEQLTREFGRITARDLGMLNEIQGGLMHDLPNLRSRLSGDTRWAFQLQDLIDNEIGIWNALSDIWDEFWEKESDCK
jgi:RHS repeat-associated protein